MSLTAMKGDGLQAVEWAYRSLLHIMSHSETSFISLVTLNMHPKECESVVVEQAKIEGTACL